MKYKMTAGFETHVELKTRTKIFCGCATDFVSEPNIHCCAVCMGHPGTLPVLNGKAVEFAVRVGLALNCTISSVSYMERKNYTYPDLPKAYQITQLEAPLGINGFVELKSGKRIGITRVQLEEDAGKLLHRDDEILIDYNRAGVPLVEIVSEPHIESIEEAEEFVEALRLIMRYIGVSDCKMQEGSMRCDVNISLSKTDRLGVRTEIKNMNSISNIGKAMEYERARQTEILENGGVITRETLGFNEKTGRTYLMRDKEAVNDYRFFREPDLLAVHISAEDIEKIRKSLPELPQNRIKRFEKSYGLKAKDAELLVKYPAVADFFEKSVKGIKSPQAVANIILGQIFSSLKTETQKEELKLKITPESFNTLMLAMQAETIGLSRLKSILDEMLETGKPLEELLTSEDMNRMTESELHDMCSRAIELCPKAAEDYKNGKDKAIMVLVGTVMRNSKGRADAQNAREYLKKLLAYGE